MAGQPRRQSFWRQRSATMMLRSWSASTALARYGCPCRLMQAIAAMRWELQDLWGLHLAENFARKYRQ